MRLYEQAARSTAGASKWHQEAYWRKLSVAAARLSRKPAEEGVLSSLKSAGENRLYHIAGIMCIMKKAKSPVCENTAFGENMYVHINIEAAYGVQKEYLASRAEYFMALLR